MSTQYVLAVIDAFANSNALRVAAYLGAACACLLALKRERALDAVVRRALWPSFWFLTCAMFVVMAVARLGDVASLIAELGREQAIAEDWYDSRRPLQALAVATIGVAWLAVVSLAILRVPERRRRYLPTAMVTFTLVCFGGLRMISLHHVDAVLYRHPILGVKIVSVVELTLLALACASVFVPLPRAVAKGSPLPA